MNINEKWEITSRSSSEFGAAGISADDGTFISQYAPRAERLVALWNAFLGVKTEDIVKAEVEMLIVPAQPGLEGWRQNEITVFWQNYKPGQGTVTITCFGEAWTASFWATGGVTIQQFFREVSVEYLVKKLGILPRLKSGKKHLAHLSRIVTAIKVEMEKQTPLVCKVEECTMAN